MCIGWLLKTQHFVQVYLKSGYPIPKTSPEWMPHFTKETETWSYHFPERMEESNKLSYIERESKKEISKKKSPINIDLGGNIYFYAF